MIPYYYGIDLDYANKRLSGTFVDTIKRKLFYLTEIRLDAKGSMVATGAFVDEDSNKEKNREMIDVAQLDMSPLQLGYVYSQRRETAIFVARLPMRNAYRQGLALSTIEVSQGSRGDITAQDLLMPIYNKYPKLATAQKLAKEHGSTFPFSRQFAVGQKGAIIYRGRPTVGHLKDSVPVLDPQFAFLQQHLDWVTK